jgi:hypothetical protein
MNIELLKYAPVEIKVRFLHIINMCWTMHKIPDECTRGLNFPIFKQGNRWDFNNYKGISLLNAAYKIYAKISTRRLNIINECTFRRTMWVS